MKNVANQRYYLVREDVLTDAMQKKLWRRNTYFQVVRYLPYGMR